jgi:two-component system sensor histidine kinase PilS (NtrC family)
MLPPDTPAQRLPPRSPTDLTWRVVGLVNLYRIVIALGFGAVGLVPALRSSFAVPSTNVLLLAAGAYLACALILAILPKRVWSNLRGLTLTHTILDSLAVGATLWAMGGVNSGLGILLVLPVGAMALLAEESDTYLLSAIATLALLAQQILRTPNSETNNSDWLLTGVLGGVLFLVTMSVRPVAKRLRDNEALVKRQESDLVNLAQLSQHIVTHLRESMVVIDSQQRIRLLNESAAQVLGTQTTAIGTPLAEISARLFELLNVWRNSSAVNPAGEGTLTATDGARLLLPRFARLSADNTEGLILIFLEDTGLLAEQVQQSKLAALGRLSASIAHEIRNPVGAMSHAGQLLAESPTLDGDDKRLTQIIRINADRISRLIENVLEFSRRGTSKPERLQLARWLVHFRNEFASTVELRDDQLQIVPLGQEDKGPAFDVEVRVDPVQLQQVVWNLCRNAMTHGCDASGLAHIELRFGRLASNGRPYLEVADKGPGVATEDAERIFEPFFTRDRRGTGLGLFLARELAQTNGATLLYERRPSGGSLFRLVFSDPTRWVM